MHTENVKKILNKDKIHNLLKLHKNKPYILWMFLE